MCHMLARLPMQPLLLGNVESAFLTGPFGSGKTVVSKMIMANFINKIKDTDTPSLVIMTHFANDKSALLDEFRAFAAVHRSEKVKVDVMGWYELLAKYKVKWSDDKVSTLNELMRAIQSKNPGLRILLNVDEIDPAAVLDRNNYDRNSYDWSALELTLTLLLSFRPVTGSTRGSTGNKMVYPSVRIVHLDRIFRSTKAIKDFIECFNNFLPDGVGDMRSLFRGSSGNSVPGVTPSWYHVPNHIDSEEGGAEFIKVMAGVSKEITGDVTIIAGGATDEESSALAATITRLTAGAHRVVKKWDFFGCEDKSIIVVSPLATGVHQDLMSRAVATLHIITYSAGDQVERGERCWGSDLVTVLGKVVEEGKLDRKDPHQGEEYRSEDPGPVKLEFYRLVSEKGFTSRGLAQLSKTSPQEFAKVTRPILAEARSNVEAKEFDNLIRLKGYTEETFGDLQLEDPDRHQTIKDEVTEEVKDRLAPKVTVKQTTTEVKPNEKLANYALRLEKDRIQTDLQIEAAKKRLLRDFKQLQNNPVEGAVCAPKESNILVWSAAIFGDDDTIFQDGTFELTLHFSHEYPYQPPTVQFLTKVFHPNVRGDTGVCQKILEQNWSPALGVADILTKLRCMLTEPNLNSEYVANPLAANIYRENRGEFNRRVRQCVDQFFDTTLTSQGQNSEGFEELSEYRSEDPDPVSLEAHRLSPEKGFTAEWISDVSGEEDTSGEEETSDEEDMSGDEETSGEEEASEEDATSGTEGTSEGEEVHGVEESARTKSFEVEETPRAEETFGAEAMTGVGETSRAEETFGAETTSRAGETSRAEEISGSEATSEETSMWSSGAARVALLSTILVGLFGFLAVWRRWK